MRRAISSIDRVLLSFLAAQEDPVWGGHLERGEPLNDAAMIGWLDRGWIEQVEDKGYRITDSGREQL